MADRQFRGHFKIILFLAIAFWLFSGGAAGACQGGQEKEESAERLLLQADQFLSQKEYSKAIGCYLEAAGIAQKKINLSRAYFGLSRAYFYLEDIDSASRWMHKVLDVDPHKEISPFFHPPSFVELFNEARKEASAAQKKEAKELILPKKPPEPEVRREEAQKETPVKPKEAPPPVKKVSPPRQEVPAPEKISTAQKWEVEAHYGSWTAGPVKKWGEKFLAKKVGYELRREITDKLLTTRPGLTQSSYEQALDLNSEGRDYGLDLRFYSQGRTGSFSLGLSLEKLRIRLALAGQAKQLFADGSSASVEAWTYLEARPLATRVSFRWDAFPSGRVSPFAVFGFGFSGLEGEFSYSYMGTYVTGGQSEIVSDSDTMTFDELEEEGDFRIPDYFFLFQLTAGLKAEMARGLWVNVESGFWDGLIIKAGLAYRF